MIDSSVVVERLKTVYDPEIPVNIFDLGLVYNIDIKNNDVQVVMTLTTATCPAAAFMPDEVKTVLEKIPGIGAISIDVVYEPKWTRDRMSAEAKEQLGFA